MAYNYSLTVNNKSQHSGYFMVYQNDPGNWDPQALSLAWFAKFSNPSPTSKVQFSWTVDWGFSWAETGELKPGIQFLASETYDPTGGKNQISLDYNGAYMFTDPTQGTDPARFYLKESSKIPVSSKASVGMTMSGSTVYATQARPNNNLTFSPHPRYFLAYGNYEPGEVIDVSTVNNPLELAYPTGVYSLTTTLNADDSWDNPLSLGEYNTRKLRLAANGSAGQSPRASL